MSTKTVNINAKAVLGALAALMATFVGLKFPNYFTALFSNKAVVLGVVAMVCSVPFGIAYNRLSSFDKLDGLLSVYRDTVNSRVANYRAIFIGLFKRSIAAVVFGLLILPDVLGQLDVVPLEYRGLARGLLMLLISGSAVYVASSFGEVVKNMSLMEADRRFVTELQHQEAARAKAVADIRAKMQEGGLRNDPALLAYRQTHHHHQEAAH